MFRSISTWSVRITANDERTILRNKVGLLKGNLLSDPDISSDDRVLRVSWHLMVGYFSLMANVRVQITCHLNPGFLPLGCVHCQMCWGLLAMQREKLFNYDQPGVHAYETR